MPQAYIRTAKDIGPKHLRMSRSQAPKKIQSTCFRTHLSVLQNLETKFERFLMIE